MWNRILDWPVSLMTSRRPPYSRRLTMKAKAIAYVLIAMDVASGTLRGSEDLLPGLGKGGQPEGAPKWEYRILTKEQIIELGKKDLAAGLNQLGDQGWELAAVETAFIFKRSRPRNPCRPRKGVSAVFAITSGQRAACCGIGFQSCLHSRQDWNPIPQRFAPHLLPRPSRIQGVLPDRHH